MSLVQHLNRKRPRPFRGDSSTSSPRNSSTPIVKPGSGNVGIISTTGATITTNPFTKTTTTGFTSVDPICLDSEEEAGTSDIFGAGSSNIDHCNFQTSRNNANNAGKLKTTAADCLNNNNASPGINYFENNNGKSKDYDSDDSVIIVDKWKDICDDKDNPFSNVHAINDFINDSSRNDSLSYNDSGATMAHASYHSDSSFNSSILQADEELFQKTKRFSKNNDDSESSGTRDLNANFASILSHLSKKGRKNITTGDLQLPQISYAKTRYHPVTNKNDRLTDLIVPLIPAPVHLNSKSIDEENGHLKVQANDYYANNRFKVVKLLGQGTFGKVVEAFDCHQKKNVAVKVIKAVPKYREAAKVELRVLATLRQFDQHNQNGCIHYNEIFDYRNHISIVTDLLSLSVYDFFDQNGFKSFPGSHIQSFAKQLIKSLVFLHDLNIIHTDLKPENILLMNVDAFSEGYFEMNKRALHNKSEKSSSRKYSSSSRRSSKKLGDSGGSEKVEFRQILKDTKINLIDFGSAVFNNEYHPELVSTRHYRAPEISFGIGWSYECDLWSIGCILVELLIGSALFNTHDNREHLLMMEKVTNQRLDLGLIRSCCIESFTALEKSRDLRKPYENYGDHYTKKPKRRSYSTNDVYGYTPREENGYGSIPSRVSNHSVNNDVYEFLKDRGDSYIRVDANKRSATHEVSNLTIKLKKPKINVGRSKAVSTINFKPTGVPRIRQRFPKDTPSKVRKNVGELLPIDELISQKIGVTIDVSLPLDEAYFKYCLQFSNEATDKKLLMSLKGSNIINPISFSHGVRTVNDDVVNEKYKNINSICGGCVNNDWIKDSEVFKDHHRFFMNLKEDIEKSSESEKKVREDLENLVMESIYKRSVSKSGNSYSGSSPSPSSSSSSSSSEGLNFAEMKKLQLKYPDRLAGRTELHINGQSIKVAKISGPIDKATFKFWYHFVDLLKKLFVFNPYERLTAHEALTHEWFNCGIYDDGTLDFQSQESR
ncbi:serine/threonine protein kinase [Saccharomycopsis crataegensis]|uniref:Serine/threonine protein kinase n=1 Tax=Saccharomycopsis crataegensis TaxID=43959 RepID=A0AAV5QMA4_9ASCO|nr:serine/threonine protein kinase [Saccharomycopsis crataegensis]